MAVKPPVKEDIIKDVRRALGEDLGAGDVTARLISPRKTARAEILSRESMVLCGRPWVREVFAQLGNRVRMKWHYGEGDSISKDAVLCELSGPARHLLSGERTALNFLQLLCGTATATQHLVRQLSDTGVKVLDTRKTIPGLRTAQKYAVRCGGGHNHRAGLFDAVLIKENHIAAAGGISNAVARAKELFPRLLIEVEVENLEQLDEALGTAANRIMLDNFRPAQLRRAVRRRNASTGKKIQLEASGGLTPRTALTVAKTGVDFISIGSLTKHVRAADLSMRFIDEGVAP